VNWRDVQKGVTMEVGTAVDFLVYADDNGLGAQDVRLQSKMQKNTGYNKAVAALEEEWAEQDAELAGIDGEWEAAASVGVAEPDQEFDDDAFEGELLPGWEQVWSDENNCHYYWHKATKTASWERPCVVNTSSVPVVKDKVWEGEGAEEGAARLATPITPFVSKPGREMTPITPAGPKARIEATRATGVVPTPATPISGKGKGKGKTLVAGKGQQASAVQLKRPGQAPSWQVPVKKFKMA